MAVAFQYLSDLHLERSPGLPLPDVPRNAPYLILAGNIGDPASQRYRAFLKEASESFDAVFVLAGAHEYHCAVPGQLQGRAWTSHVDSVIRRATETTASRYNVVFLQNEVVDIQGTDVSLFGGTLWTDVPPADERMVFIMAPEYSRIPGFTIAVCRSLHAETVEALQTAMHSRPDRVFVVATHHGPRKSLIYQGSPLSSAFASDVACADDERIVAWVNGHAHAARDDGKYHCNPVEYHLCARGVDLGRVFTVPEACDPAAKRRCV